MRSIYSLCLVRSRPRVANAIDRNKSSCVGAFNDQIALRALQGELVSHLVKTVASGRGSEACASRADAVSTWEATKAQQRISHSSGSAKYSPLRCLSPRADSLWPCALTTLHHLITPSHNLTVAPPPTSSWCSQPLFLVRHLFISEYNTAAHLFSPSATTTTLLPPPPSTPARYYMPCTP